MTNHRKYAVNLVLIAQNLFGGPATVEPFCCFLTLIKQNKTEPHTSSPDLWEEWQQF